MSSSSNNPTTTLKVYFTLPSGKQEIRRFTTNERPVLPALLAFLSATYERHYTPPLRFVMQYDDGEDLCSVSSEAEMQEGLALHAASGAGGALKLLAAFDTQPLQSQSVEPSSVQQEEEEPLVETDEAEMVELLGATAEPSSDSEYDRIEDECTGFPKAAPVSEPESVFKARPPSPSATSATAGVEVEDEGEQELANEVAAAVASSPTRVDEDAAPSLSPEVRIEDVSFSSVPVEEATASASASVSATSGVETAVHRGITCDGCGMSPLIGTRFHCLTCGPARGGFDLCQSCEESGGKHPTTHQFHVMTEPMQRCGWRRGWRRAHHEQQAQAQTQEQKASSETTSSSAEDPVRVVQQAVQRVVSSLQEHQNGSGSGPAPLQVIQEGVTQVLSVIMQAGQPRQQHEQAPAKEEQKSEAQEAATSSASASASASAPAANAGPTVHHDVTCDGCGQSPIVGVRYCCRTCRMNGVEGGFDLCSKCEDAGFTKGDHDDTHLMLKMKQEHTGRGGWRHGHGHGHGHGHSHHQGPHRGGMGGHGGMGHHGPQGGMGHHGPHGGMGHHGPHGGMGHGLGGLGGLVRMLGGESLGLGGLFGGQGRGGCGMGMGRGGFGGRRHCPFRGQRDETERPRAQFISDVTLADGLQVKAGEVLRKVWSVKNVGTAPWPVGTRLVFVGGDLAPESDGRWGCDASGALVPFAGPGDVVHVSIDVQVPNEPGRFRCTFRLQTAEGDRFGPRVWIDLRVPEASAEKEAQPKQATEESTAAAAPAAAASAPVAPASRPTPVALPVAVPVVKAVSVQVAAPAAPAAPAPAAKQSTEESALADEFREAHISPQPEAAGAGGWAGRRGGRPAFQYANELGYLASMGFTDRALCKYLLLNNNGDITAVVQWLLANSKA